MNLRLSPLTAALLMAITAPALAAPGGDVPADAAMQAKELDTVEVHGERVQKASSPKYTEDLVDTPQTITVVTSEVMAQQNLLGLKDVLSTLPGITFGAGEGGGGYGDSINLRGFTASSDITTDGVRDSAQYTRSDTFNLESIELINGANSAMSGAGSVGGTINLVSKTAREGDFNTFTMGAGSDKYSRVTADSNVDFENGIAVRLNAMGHTQDVPGRDEEFKHRWGFAPSIAFGLDSDTRFTLSYLHQHDNNMPQYGVPFALSPFNDGPLPGVDRETYFGYRNTSRQESDVDMLTGVFEMDFGDHVGLRSLARLQRVEQYTNATALQGSWCLPNNTNPYTGQACVGQPAGTWNPNGGPRGLVRDTENFIAHSQTDLTASFSTGAVRHDVVVGVSFSKEDFELDTGTTFRNPDGSTTGITYPIQNFDNPYNVWTGPQNYFRTGRTEGSLNNQAVYVFDTLKFGDQWLLNLGARYEHNEGDTVNYAVSTTGQITGVSGVFENEDDLFSYRAGLVYKPVDNASVYLSYANSKTPSKSSVNGACSAVTCNVDPETAVNIELGTKWDVLENRLAVTAALFRNERQNYKVASVDPLQPEQVLDGKARVDGIALGVAGNITREWAVFANYTFLDSEVLQNAADGAPSDPVKGNELTQTPRHSASLWSTYELGDWTFGYGATYQGSFYPNNSSATAYLETEAYWVHRAMVGYQINERIGLQLNVSNLFDEEYYTGIRNNLTVNGAGVVTAGNGWANPGEGRSAVLTATFRF
ncbi:MULTISPECIES: TonB-dependent siderophore receptor [unclassified Pseudoxanthomonas]|uniref:TonB-dependent receptor n=1 Tax=unclassified Pseudoxanthomonas TaxID=2645906 RepID=UPI0008E5B0CE|nr:MULTISPECIES: TonB-dependent siderophore receptor [unclassified Pseudoxanthomonas]PPJ43444.1 TonB-dependent siderophore receptor [Pseudoxanthomonas sp. KAs_5_3]SFV35276.1 catecholate siderophore receptor [Pseudoxanthomonas sp. YR558]